jgi:hypothetical protein
MQAHSGSHAVDFSEGIRVDSDVLNSIIGNQASLGKHKNLKIGLEAKKNILDGAQVVGSGEASRRRAPIFTGQILAGSQIVNVRLSTQDISRALTTKRDVDSTKGHGVRKKSNLKPQGNTKISPSMSPTKRRDGSVKISGFTLSGFQEEIHEPSDLDKEFKPRENPFLDDQLSSASSSVQDLEEMNCDFDAKKMIKRWQRDASDLFQSYQTN